MQLPRIGIFDSGVGGLSVLSACESLLPPAMYFYYGDNVHAPYGERSDEEIAAFTHAALRCMEGEGIELAVLACNTASAACLGEMRAAFSFPVVGMEPAVSLAAGYGRVLVLATPFTAKSARLAGLLVRFPQTEYTVCALPHLAAAVEEKLLRGIPLVLSDHLPRPDGWEAAVLGCTHYSLIREEIAAYYGIPVFDGARGTARRVGELLKLGPRDHREPQLTTEIAGENRIIFLGISAELNEAAYKTNICFQFCKKK